MEDKRCENCMYFSDLFIDNDDYGRCCKNERNVCRRAITCKYFEDKEIKRCQDCIWFHDIYVDGNYGACGAQHGKKIYTLGYACGEFKLYSCSDFKEKGE